MNIEDMIMNGASEDEIQKALNEIRAEKQRQEEALRAKSAKNKETLKAEGRAYAINAILAYSQAFDLLSEDEIDDELVGELEELAKAIEDMAPMYIKMFELERKMKAMGMEDLNKFLDGMMK
jgi:regulator of protease activity HflC (stomatin/prohibitin superfamily)